MNMGADGEILHDAAGVPFLTCGFFTDGYAAEAAQLRDSLERTGTPYFLKRFPSRGYWEANTRIKPEFLLDCLRRFPGRDVVYLDADSVVRSPLELFYRFDADLGVFVAPDSAGMSHRYLTGTLYLRNTPAVHAFVEDWIAAQDGMVLGVDQDSFSAAVDRHPELKLGPLPERYVKIFDRGSETPVVEHFQASRQRVKLQRTMKKARNVAIGLALVAALIWLATNG
ncbi:putative nucleotide-diphospho-sugar transferase [Zoogloea sp.]|jgi:hypothetical protein|uniref:putative nucleotide-diphospho-sugar transferase n=1 Tax=Zoogloea sp. TaxID=49181 RepID=UPI0035AF29D5